MAATSVTGNTTIETTPSPTAGGETESPLPGARDIAATSSPSAFWVFVLFILLFGVSSADDVKLGELSVVLLRALASAPARPVLESVLRILGGV